MKRTYATMALLALTLAAGCGGDAATTDEGGGEQVSAEDLEAPFTLPYASGSASVTITEGFEATLELPVGTASSYGDSSMSLSFSQDSDAFSINGESFIGTLPTSSTLQLQIQASPDQGAVFDVLSFSGECGVTIASASAAGLEGSFDCAGLEYEGEAVRASGEFSLSA